MKAIFLSIYLAVCVVLCQGVSQPIIPNTRAEGCIDGVCSSHCAWDGVKIFPGDNLNQPGKCRLLKCSSDFSVHITPCPFDMSGQFEWIGKDRTKLYPDCCGTKSSLKSKYE